MIAKVFTADAQVIWQSPDREELPNSAILVQVDCGGSLCIEQEENTIVIDRATLPELISILKKYLPAPEKKSKK